MAVEDGVDCNVKIKGWGRGLKPPTVTLSLSSRISIAETGDIDIEGENVGFQRGVVFTRYLMNPQILFLQLMLAPRYHSLEVAAA